MGNHLRWGIIARLSGVLTLCLLCALNAAAQSSRYPPRDEQIPPPDCLNPVLPNQGQQKICEPADYAAWLDDITHWRTETRIRMGYSDEAYLRPELQWTQSSFIQPQMMIEDRYFYDVAAGKYTVDKYLDDLQTRYGGIDSVLIWHTYPNIGMDDRNQYDLLAAMPGGIAGVRQMVADFHRRGVRVLFPIMLWDQGTHDQGAPDWEATAKFMTEVGADGINGDTLRGIPRAFFTSSDALHHPLALEPEHVMPYELTAWNTMSWGYWQYPTAPLVSVYKWLETRHMVNVSDRWNHGKVDNLQYAFFNGVGYESWENIWGIWNGIVPRDAEALRRVAKIERAFSEFLVSPQWQPYTPTMQFDVYASRWPRGHATLWTIVNRNQSDVTGQQLRVTAEPKVRYYDVWNGTELTPEANGDSAILSFPIEAKGFVAILATPDALTAGEEKLLGEMKTLSGQSLSSFSNVWHSVNQQITPMAKTAAPSKPPENMIKIPAADFVFKVDGIELEGFNDVGVDVQYPWEDSPRRHHRHTLHVDSFWIDTYPVTNVQFKKFMDASGYHPQDSLNFLRNWKNGAYPADQENQPVTWVSLEDARAYTAWAGKRLPHEWEWQYAAQGSDGRLYPWGNGWNAANMPAPDRGRTLRGADKVDAHPAGASPFGVMDLVGNVWQWTDEFSDEHTRAGIVRGGSYYQPQGSVWYFPQAYRLDQHGKLLMMAPSKDRAGTLGFRCVRDAN